MQIRAGILVLALLASLAWGQAPATAPSTSAAAVPKQAAVITLSGTIDTYSRQRLFERFAEARALGVSRIILKINTYGGRVDAALDMSRFLRQQDDLHVIAYVEDKAISAGAMIALAADEIVMEPETLIGDAAPISVGAGGGAQEMAPTERAKAESPVLEDFYASAIKNGYDPLLVSSMVSVGRVVHWIEHAETGERRFVDSTQYEKLTAGGESAQWRPVAGVRDPIDSGETLLTLSADLAAKVGIARQIVRSVDELAAARGLVIVARLEPTLNDHVLGFLNGMVVRGVLVMVLMFSLYAAFNSPGQGLPEAAALICLGVLLGVPMLTGYAQWYEVVAVLLGLTLVALEIFVIPGFGIPGLAGIVLVLGGLMMTFLPPLHMPGLPIGFGIDWEDISNALGVIVGGMLASVLLWWWLSRYLPKMPYFNRLVLEAPGDSATVGAAPASGTSTAWPTVGMRGTVVADLRPGGLAEFFDETTNDRRTVDVVCDCGYVSRGTAVIVRQIEGNRIVVRPEKA